MSIPTLPHPRRLSVPPYLIGPRNRLALALFVLLCVVMSAGPGRLGVVRAQPEANSKRLAQLEINPDGYTSARTCGRCHVDIYNSWKNSLHAFSLTDPIFDTAYMQALKEVGDRAKRLCLSCHAPMTLANEDYDLKQGVTREGVSCDFCHTVTSVDLSASKNPYSMEPGLIKRGIIKEAGSPTHEVAYSALHGTSEFCGGCHNYVSESGVSIMSTYEEWLAGPYAERGVQCQNCHMVLSEGKIVTEEVKQLSSTGFHVHSLIHDTDQLRNALTIEIASAKRSGRDLRVEVRVRNSGSGHMLPTGMPTREVVLAVQATWGDQIRTDERRYRKTLLDESGRTLLSDVESMLYAAQVGSDNRIGPEETRIERFEFTVPESGSVKVTATASYQYSPPVLDKLALNVKLAEAERYAQ